MTALRLLLLLALSFQTVASSWATFSSIPCVPTHSLPSSLKFHTDPLALIDVTGVDHLVHGKDSMETPCDLTDCETWDSASDEGLRENMRFNLVEEENKTGLPRSEPWYNFFRQYSIPPPEFI